MDNRAEFNAWVNEAPNQRYGAVYWECWQACAELKQSEIDRLTREMLVLSVDAEKELNKANARIAEYNEDLDIRYHALNYRTASIKTAESFMQELEACVNRLIAVEIMKQNAKNAKQ